MRKSSNQGRGVLVQLDIGVRRSCLDKICLLYFSTFLAPAWRSGLVGRHVNEHCLATLIDQHINVTEHVYLAHEGLHVIFETLWSVA